jgi:quercetin dioxygenase-like cupin family protein
MQRRTPGAGAHFHRTMSESFFILSGTIRLFNGERWIASTAGDFLHVPEDGVHGFHNDSDEWASSSATKRREICRRHDSYFL